MTEQLYRDRFERVAQRIAPRSVVLRLWPLAGGASAQMTALELRLPNGQIQTVVVRRPGTAAVKQNSHAAAHEYRLLQHLTSIGLFVPPPLYLDLSADIFPFPYLVIKYVDGQPDFAPVDLPDFIRQIAAQLAQIHRVDVAHADVAFLAVQATSLTAKVEERLALLDHPLVGINVDSILERMRSLPNSGRRCLLHGDFWPGNMLWKEGQLVAVVDWEDAELGDPLSDFAISRLDTLLVFGPEAMHQFTHHYQALTQFDLSDLPYWDFYAALRAAPHLADWPAVYPHFGRYDITEASMRSRHAWFLEMTLDRLSDG